MLRGRLAQGRETQARWLDDKPVHVHWMVELGAVRAAQHDQEKKTFQINQGRSAAPRTILNRSGFAALFTIALGERDPPHF